MNFNLKFDEKNAILAFDKFELGFRAKLKTLVDEYGAKMLSNIQSEMKKPKHGRWYPRPGGGKYRASAPGEAPAIRTGFLYNSLTKKTDYSTDSVISRVFTNVYYMKFLENKNILNRQVFKPTLAITKNAFVNDVVGLISNYSKKI